VRATFLIVAFAAGTAQACGYCVEDKIAAVYDHALADRAAQQKHRLVYFALLGDIVEGVDGEKTRRALAESAAKVTGVDAGSVRVSLSAASLALAFDPQTTSLARVEQALARALAAQRLSVGILRVVDAPARSAGAI
jgi:hypothetical protein